EGQEGGLGWNVTLRRAIEESLKHVETRFRDHPLLEARLRTTLGKSFHYLGDEKAAIEQFQKARMLYKVHSGPDDPDTLRSTYNLAESYRVSGQSADAQRLLQETLELQEEKLGRDHPDTLTTSAALGCAYRQLGRLEVAVKLHEETLKLLENRLGP